MSSFAALGYTFGAGTVITSLVLSVFGYSVRNQKEGIAPRCAARPPDTIYCLNPTHRDQNRGNPFFGWIRWTLKWSYETLLRGVPGTGTRKNGLEGCMLNMNLDAIIFLRFNALCLRVSTLTAVLVMLVVLPANWTGDPTYKLNTFNRTTLANIPALHEDNHNITLEDVFAPATLFKKLHVNLKAEMPIQLRLYAIVFCSWAVAYFLCTEIKKEWKDNLALRRKHYFEADHYKQEKDKRSQAPAENVDYISKRDPWVPNPEERDTVVNIGLYSLLVGGVPPLPKELQDQGYTEQQEIDWQTAAVTTFFDNCVPNQPGFTSSVAAITMLPSALSLSKAWKEWNKAATALKRLRGITAEIDNRNINPSISVEMVGMKELTREQAMKKCKESNHGTSSKNIFTSFRTDENMSSNQKMLMIADFDDDVEYQLMDALQYGPQQKAFYGREFAQASASIFGNYFLSRKYKNATDAKLVEYEMESLKNVEETNKSLIQAQRNTVKSNSTTQNDENNNNAQDKGHTFKSLTTGTGKLFIAQLLSLSKTGKIDDHNNNATNHDESSTSEYRLSGEWIKPVSAKGVCQFLCLNIKKVLYSRPKCMSAYSEKSTYAVVTFTNRQAAVAARQCVADGRGIKHWNEFREIPTPPLADAPPFSLYARDFFRPVTVTIFSEFKVARNWIKNILLITINIFYTIPLTALASLSNGRDLVYLFPNSKLISNHNKSLDGLLYALLYTLFVVICPYMFEFLACWGSKASSLSTAELAAMKYYWLFILMTSFTGVNIANSIVAAMKAEQEHSSLIYTVVKSVADTIPVSISFNWLNIIIKDATLTMPVFYLLQTHYSIFSLVGCTKIGIHPIYVAGTHLPYRAYIDCGTIFLCAVALSFASPLVAPFAALFFLISEPIMRRSFLYVYTPEFDGGGFRWPFLSDMCYSSMVMGQVLLLFMVSFRRAIFPAILSFIPIIFTLLSRTLTLYQYYNSYIDTSLLQTASLDMCDPSERTTLRERRLFRDFLVDAHKAAYIPVCIAGSTASILTSQPAVAVWNDLDLEDDEEEDIESSISVSRGSICSAAERFPCFELPRGASLRRTGGTLSHRSLSCCGDDNSGADLPRGTSLRRIGDTLSRRMLTSGADGNLSHRTLNSGADLSRGASFRRNGGTLSHHGNRSLRRMDSMKSIGESAVSN